jgi:soluble lytic murein transglycosylase
VLSKRIVLTVLAAVLLLMAGEFLFLYWRDHQPLHENRFDPMIVAAAREYDVDPFLIRALIWRESRFDPSTYGTAQEHGLMQVTPAVGVAWAKANKVPHFQPSDLFDPLLNIRVGTWYLSHALKRWTQADDPVPFALAEYNAGRSNALKWVDPSDPNDHTAFLNRITFPTTRKYVEVILERREVYRTALAHNRWYREFAPSPASVTSAP